jgi:hypothetical protein
MVAESWLKVQRLTKRSVVIQAHSKILLSKEIVMSYSIPRRKGNAKWILFFTISLSLVVATYGHTIKGINNPAQATARLSSLTTAVDSPIPIPGSQLSIVCFKVQNTSPFDARITAIGFGFPGDFSGFELVDPASVDQTNPSAHVTLQSYQNFSIENETGPVPGFECANLDFALQIGKNFKNGNADDGLAPSLTATTFCVKGPFPKGLSVEEILNYSFVRFRKVGPNGTENDIGIWEKLFHP